MKKIPIIIDTDPGVDDALALMLLSLKKEKYDIKLLSSCAGNINIDTTTKNLKLFAKSFFDTTPLSKGYGKPISRTFEASADEVHGDLGLGDINIVEQEYDVCKNMSHIEMYNILQSSTEQITFICLGPLTNIALLITEYPQIINKIKQIYCMIGSIYGVGNIKPYAEFNAYYDPEAFEIVAKSNINLIFNTIEVGKTCRLSKDRITNEIGGTKWQEVAKAMIQEMYEPDDEHTICLFDPCSFLSLDNPNLFEYVNCDVAVNISNYPGKCVLTENLASKNKYIVPKSEKEIEDYVISQLKQL